MQPLSFPSNSTAYLASRKQSTLAALARLEKSKTSYKNFVFAERSVSHLLRISVRNTYIVSRKSMSLLIVPISNSSGPLPSVHPSFLVGL